MKVAVSSTNMRKITGPAKSCQSFWIYEIDKSAILEKQHIRLKNKECLKELKTPLSSLPEHPLHGIKCLITESVGEGVNDLLEQDGIKTISTNGADPDGVIKAYISIL